ncbi:exo-alpha-sialidase [Pseudodesulfovibrio sp. F-1]|uniref:Exo-alpha-sialidase n=1 Tax=Pseudodesulfovibrio alkaliphilus TaxID=2661613 RepID=A0A7K1KRC0_9BACT|nr:sialidase family protein [Pseudodesulfovibrio alkaliphilus]MUM78646.1 exo-alpha-sialidase [Pseudodesulfovibrio alkaliphilus]
MPSLTNATDRHTVIDRREGHYLCFPDVVCTGDRRLIVAYNEYDQHVGTRRALLVKESADGGRSFGEAMRMDVPWSHCPRIAPLHDGRLIMTDDAGPRLYLTSDLGRTWDTLTPKGLHHALLDRPIELEDGALLTTGHQHRGTVDHPAIRQANTEQMVYRSEDAGCTWTALSVVARPRNLVLCEASMALLPDGRLLALMRENSFVYEPMYLCVSRDLGRTWSDPAPTPLIGHRPTLGLTGDGKLLVTYRNVGPDGGTCAWLGSEEELSDDFRVHGRHPDPANPSLTPEGLRVCGQPGPGSVVRYALRPMTDPRSARATLEAEVRVDHAGPNGCGLRLGVWFRLFPDRIETAPDPQDPSEQNSKTGATVPLEPGRFHTIRLDYAAGRVALSTNGQRRAEVRVDDDHADTRAILFGAPYPFEDNAVDCTWKRIKLRIDEPAMLRAYAWEWDALDGLPDQWVQTHVLELMNDRFAVSPDFGYSGWASLGNGEYFCAYHHGGSDEQGYEPMHSAHVMGTHICEDDFA